MTGLLRMLIGAGGGALIGLLLIAVGLLRAGLAVFGGTHISWTDAVPDMAGYVTACAAGGSTMGLLWPLHQRPFGCYLLGTVGAAVLVTAILRLEEGPLSTWESGTVVIGAGLSLLFGIAFGRGLRGA